ncbi:MAG: RNA polymerase sigma factor, partial [Gemmataceae bacterium]
MIDARPQTVEPPTDALLLSRYRRGDTEALGELLDRYETSLFQFLLGMVRNRHAAEDILQETFVQVLRFGTAAQDESFRGWLYTIAHRQAALFKRQEKKRALPATEQLLTWVRPGETTPADSAEVADDARHLMVLLQELPTVQQSVIQLRVFEGLKFREIAERIGCPLNTALARMHDGLHT